VNIAIFYNFWHYYTVTGDLMFMELYGAEVILEIARFWALKAELHKKSGRYEIIGVMGPDEFHEKFPPNAERGGVRNNAYTNIMVAWLLSKALQILFDLPRVRRRELVSSLHLTDSELQQWAEISRKMFVPFHDDVIISQFEGYGTLKELNWDAYRAKYQNIQRLDRILRAEGDSPDNYKLSKQADVCMLFYLLPPQELLSTLHSLGYPFSKELILQNINYYLRRTSHGSTLSLVVFSYILFDFDLERSWDFYKQFILSDIVDVQQGTTAEGIHVVPMAASLNYLFYKCCGIDFTQKKVIKLDPKLPPAMKGLKGRIQYRGDWVSLDLSHSRVIIGAEKDGEAKLPISFRDETHDLLPGSFIELSLVD